MLFNCLFNCSKADEWPDKLAMQLIPKYIYLKEAISKMPATSCNFILSKNVKKFFLFFQEVSVIRLFSLISSFYFFDFLIYIYISAASLYSCRLVSLISTGGWIHLSLAIWLNWWFSSTRRTHQMLSSVSFPMTEQVLSTAFVTLFIIVRNK